MENSSQSLRPRSDSKSTNTSHPEQVRFKNRTPTFQEPTRNYCTIKRKPTPKQTIYGSSPKRFSRKCSDSSQPPTKKDRPFDSLSKLKDLARSIREATLLCQHPRRKRSSSNLQAGNLEKFNRSVELGRNGEANTMKQAASTDDPGTDYGIPQLLESNNKLHALLVHEKDVEVDNLREQIARKQEEVDLVKKKYQNQKKLLLEEIDNLDHNNKDLQKESKQLKTLIKSYESTIDRLNRQLCFYRAQLPRQTSSSMSTTKPPSSHPTPPPQPTPTLSPCQCRKFKKDLIRLQHQLRKAQRATEQYQGVICDLHLTNQMYKQQLDICGQSRKQEFIEAEARMLQGQANRKKM